MGVIVRNMMLVMFVWLLLVGVCLGKQVYLTDGGIIECESFWRRGDQVIVKVNRDIMIDFAQSEIDVQRTFRQTAKKTRPAGAKKSVAMSAKAPQAGIAAATVAPAMSPPVAAVPAAKPVPPPAPTPAPATEPAQSAAADPATPPDKAELERRSSEAAAMMAEAIEKKDPELLKKAVEAQRNAMPQQGAQGKAFGVGYLLLLLAICLLVIVAMWVVFERCGESGWKSLVPIYNMYILMIIAGKPGWWLILLFVPIVGTVIYLMAMLSLAERFGRGALFGVGLFFLPMFFFPLLAFGGQSAEA